MKKFNWFKKVLLFSLPVAGLGIATPIILTSCGTSNSSEPGWKSSGLPSGMTLESHNNAVIKLGTTGFWTTGLTSSSNEINIITSIGNFQNGLGKLLTNYLYLPSLGNWNLDISSSTSSPSLGASVNDNIGTGGNYEIIWHYINDNREKVDVKLTLTGFVTTSTQS